MDSIKTGIELYERGLQYLKKYQHDSANSCFRVAYDLLQEDTTVDCYPDLCYYLSKGHSYYRTLEERIHLDEEILEGYERMVSTGKEVPQKRIKEPFLGRPTRPIVSTTISFPKSTIRARAKSATSSKASPTATIRSR